VLFHHDAFVTRRLEQVVAMELFTVRADCEGRWVVS